ncbi:WD repeat-containing protein 41 isoform X2 [Pseudochaenichthys georgianus]|uniref:WD repeat-containing protein 41 isoform X2 n=1 Tax=Pseudochaenichthys georgianus TaxID=52239 RepID=UPI0039C4A876
MLRWILGGREAQGSLEKSSVLCIGEEQPKNWFTELQVLKGHFDIVRFLVQIDDFRCASAGDDGLVLVWNVETGERLQELRGHSQQITAMTTFSCDDGDTTHTSLLTASSDRSLSLWDPDTGNRVQTISDLQSSVKCLLVLERLCVFVSGGGELCVWNKDFQLQCQRPNHSDTGITALIELPKNCIAAAMDKEIVIYRLTVSTDTSISVAEVRCLSDHQDRIRALINVNDGLFASGSHAGELILWDAIEWNIMAYEHILWEESQACTQAEIRLAAPKPSEMSIQHLTTNGRHILAAVGSGLYVFSVLTKTVVAYRKAAHDSNVLHTMLLSDRLLWHVDFRPGEQTERSSVKEGGGRPKHPDAGADGGSHWTLGSCPDVRELQGERFGHLLHGPPADPVEERREAVPAPQPGTVPEAGGE